MLAESLVGPLKKEHEHEHDDLIHSLTALLLRAVGFNQSKTAAENNRSSRDKPISTTKSLLQ
jgi:hypothetical protein